MATVLYVLVVWVTMKAGSIFLPPRPDFLMDNSVRAVETEDELKVIVDNSVEEVYSRLPPEAKITSIIQQYLEVPEGSHRKTNGETKNEKRRVRCKADQRVTFLEQTKSKNSSNPDSDLVSHNEGSGEISQARFHVLLADESKPEADLIKKVRLTFPAPREIDGYRPDIEIDIVLQPIIPGRSPIILCEIEMDRLDLQATKFLPSWMDWKVTEITNYEIACGKADRLG